MKNCVITGGSGLVGAHLMQSLHRQWRICATARTALANPLPNVDIQSIDLSTPWDTKTLPGKVDAVIHLAQSARFRDFPEQADQVFQVNTVSTLRLLDYARRADAHTFILASSGGVYGHGTQAFSEDAQIPYEQGLPFYLNTRLCAEILAGNYTPFMNVIVLRFFFVYGPGQRPTMLIPRLVQAVIDGQPITLQGPEGLHLNPTYASDAAAAIQRALDLQDSHTINIGGPDVLSLRQISNLIGEAVGKTPRFEMHAVNQAPHLVGNISKMTHLLGKPQIGFATGIRRYVASLVRSA
ncbi:MAG: NAD-dependent epimerase/dehydratase family protein [Candidatus Binatia bacterium]